MDSGKQKDLQAYVSQIVQIDRSFGARRAGCRFMCKTGAEDRMRMICVKRARRTGCGVICETGAERAASGFICLPYGMFRQGTAAFEPSDLQNSDFGGRRHDDDRKKRKIG